MLRKTIEVIEKWKCVKRNHFPESTKLVMFFLMDLPYFRFYKPHLNKSRAKRAFCDVFEMIFDDFRIEAAPKSLENKYKGGL